MMELLVTLAIAGVVAAVALPSAARTVSDLRLSGDARTLHNMVGLAKMRAAARFTRERIFVDRTTGTYQMQYWDKVNSKWVSESPSVNTLSTGVQFGYGSLNTPPPNTQLAIGQSPACTNDAGTTISNTSCIIFNTRGIPVTSTGAITGNSGLYITDGVGTYAVTLSATPLIRLWWTKASAAKWIKR